MKLTETWVQDAIDGRIDGVELVALEEAGSRRARVLRLYVDHPDGVTHDLCAQVSAVVGEALDLTDWTESPYTLEVSSPGLDRPLRKPDHFRAQVGKKVYVKTFAPVAGRRVWRGSLVEVLDDAVVVREGEEEATVAFDQITQAHVVYEFE
ncbi:MAG: ribosome maturation factor RimP [Thermoleophilia bacterium]